MAEFVSITLSVFLIWLLLTRRDPGVQIEIRIEGVKRPEAEKKDEQWLRGVLEGLEEEEG